jgi:hypothetical protein
MPAVSQTRQLAVIGHLLARPRYASIKRTTGRDEPSVKAPSLPTRCAWGSRQAGGRRRPDYLVMCSARVPRGQAAALAGMPGGIGQDRS